MRIIPTYEIDESEKEILLKPLSPRLVNVLGEKSNLFEQGKAEDKLDSLNAAIEQGLLTQTQAIRLYRWTLYVFLFLYHEPVYHYMNHSERFELCPNRARALASNLKQLQEYCDETAKQDSMDASDALTFLDTFKLPRRDINGTNTDTPYDSGSVLDRVFRYRRKD